MDLSGSPGTSVFAKGSPLLLITGESRIPEAASDSSGLAGALDLSAARRIAPEVILSGNLSAIQSEAYEDVRLGLALTWVPGGRDGLVRNDLPQDPFNPNTWTQP